MTPQPSRRTRALYLTAFAIALGLLSVGSLFLGTSGTPPNEVLSALFRPESASREAIVLVYDLRLPRILIGIAVGCALGLAGALTQGLTRNALADPGLLGISSGAALAVVCAAVLWGVTVPSTQVWFAFGGAVLGAALVFTVSTLGGAKNNPLTLVLAGAALTAFLVAMTTMLVLSDRGALDVQRYWQAGSVTGRSLDALLAILPYLVFGALLALASARSLTLLGLGEDAARALGVRTGLLRGTGFLAIVLLTGAATAIAGPIGFVGLVVPHIARLLGGPDYSWVVRAAALLGGIVVVLADTVGRLVRPPAEVPAGIMLALIGAPVFIALVRRRLPVQL